MNNSQGTIRNITPMTEEPGLFTWLWSLITRKPKERTVYDLPIAFHRDTAGMISHGVVIVTNREFKLNNSPIRFSFVGCSHAPVMTPDVLHHLWIEARNQGFVPHALLSYGATVN